MINTISHFRIAQKQYLKIIIIHKKELHATVFQHHTINTHLLVSQFPWQDHWQMTQQKQWGLEGQRGQGH